MSDRLIAFAIVGLVGLVAFCALFTFATLGLQIGTYLCKLGVFANCG